jgi:hypothetical protein
MSRGFTYGGGQPRVSRWFDHFMVCAYCDNTVQLRYRTNSVTDSERATDLYRALREQRWTAIIEDRSHVRAICPTCKAADHD